MKFRKSFVALCLGLMLCMPALAAPAEKKPGGDKSAEAIKDVIPKALAAWETLDPANAAPFYAKDASLAFFDLTPLKYTGWDEYAEGVKKVAADFATIKFRLGDDLQIHHSGNVAWTTATLGLDVVTKGGAKLTYDGRWTLALEKRGKDWLIAHEHYSVPMPNPDTSRLSLYKRLGGYDALDALSIDFSGRLAKDPQFARFFTGHATDSLKRIHQLAVEKLCEATGGPCAYIGRDLKTAHAGLGISEGDWQVAVKHLVATLDKFNVPQREKDDFLSAFSGLRKDIVSAK